LHGFFAIITKKIYSKHRGAFLFELFSFFPRPASPDAELCLLNTEVFREKLRSVNFNLNNVQITAALHCVEEKQSEVETIQCGKS